MNLVHLGILTPIKEYSERCRKRPQPCQITHRECAHPIRGNYSCSSDARLSCGEQCYTLAVDWKVVELHSARKQLPRRQARVSVFMRH
jgi:hypothetical protein